MLSQLWCNLGASRNEQNLEFFQQPQLPDQHLQCKSLVTHLPCWKKQINPCHAQSDHAETCVSQKKETRWQIFLLPAQFSALLATAKPFRERPVCESAVRSGMDARRETTPLTYYFLYWWRLRTDTKTRVTVGKQSDGASAVPLLKSNVFAGSKQSTAFEAATNDSNCVTPPLWMSNENSLVLQAGCCNRPGWYLSI